MFKLRLFHVSCLVKWKSGSYSIDKSVKNHDKHYKAEPCEKLEIAFGYVVSEASKTFAINFF